MLRRRHCPWLLVWLERMRLGRAQKRCQSVVGVQGTALIKVRAPLSEQLLLDFAVCMKGTLGRVDLGAQSTEYVIPRRVSGKSKPHLGSDGSWATESRNASE